LRPSFVFFSSEALRLAEERANDLEELKASKRARKKAEKDATGVEDLHRRLQVAEDALSDKESKIVQRENDLITRFETQCGIFSSNTISPFVLLLSLSCWGSIDIDKIFPFSSRENW
jgi:F420-0:gamma-glutamyl ligase